MSPMKPPLTALLLSGVSLLGASLFPSCDSVREQRLFYAVAAGDSEQLSRLLDEGADVNAAYAYRDYTPLHLAVWAGDAGLARLLIEQGAAGSPSRATHE